MSLKGNLRQAILIPIPKQYQDLELPQGTFAGNPLVVCPSCGQGPYCDKLLGDSPIWKLICAQVRKLRGLLQGTIILRFSGGHDYFHKGPPIHTTKYYTYILYSRTPGGKGDPNCWKPPYPYFCFSLFEGCLAGPLAWFARISLFEGASRRLRSAASSFWRELGMRFRGFGLGFTVLGATMNPSFLRKSRKALSANLLQTLPGGS